MSLPFVNPELQSIHSNAEKSISSHLAQLDEVSNDIKALEQVLSKAGISINFEYRFIEKSYSSSKRVYFAEDDYSPYEEVPTVLEVLHYIVWNRDSQRLIYEVRRTHTQVVEKEVVPTIWGPKITISKPLIETKAHIRQSVQPELPFFYNLIIAQLGQGQVRETVEVTSPNLTIPF